MDAGIATLLAAVIPAIGTIIVAIIANRQNKSNAEFRKLQEDNIRLQEEARLAEKEERAILDKEMKDDISNLAKEVAELRKEMDTKKITEDLQQLKVLNQFNFEYIQSLSSVVVTVGDTVATIASKEGRANTDAIAKMNKSISAHHTKELAMTTNLYKLVQ